jgi:hypothetical protein
LQQSLQVYFELIHYLYKELLCNFFHYLFLWLDRNHRLKIKLSFHTFVLFFREALRLIVPDFLDHLY